MIRITFELKQQSYTFNLKASFINTQDSLNRFSNHFKNDEVASSPTF